MKLVRYGRPGREQPGLLDAEGRIRDLGRVIEDVTPAALTPAAVKRLRALNPARLPLVRGRPRLGCPVARIGKLVCIGLNYTDHAKEVNLPLPAEPLFFIKAPSAICGPDDPIVTPRGATKLDYEVELGVVIGRDARYLDEKAAMSHVAGYCVVNDVSERAFQMERGGTTTKGKSADSFGPVGPWLVTADEVRDPQALQLWTTVNGETRQNGSTANMLFTVAFLVAYVTQFLSLQAGDVISTGTPAGVGHGHKPPRYLQRGDVVELGITGLGVQRHEVVAWDAGPKRR
jgi:2-keto-4-pentenoate hydratase/2-oxohepta-3-ene-1,7-dioic acid hydratase in catechol pathway